MSEVEPEILYDVSEHAARITINRPQRANALTMAGLAALVEGFERAADEPEERIVVLAAAGDKAFYAGIDLKAAAETTGGTRCPTPMRGLRRNLSRLRSKPTNIGALQTSPPSTRSSASSHPSL